LLRIHGVRAGRLLLPLFAPLTDKSANVEWINKSDEERALVLPPASVRPFFLTLVVEEDLV